MASACCSSSQISLGGEALGPRVIGDAEHLIGFKEAIRRLLHVSRRRAGTLGLGDRPDHVAALEVGGMGGDGLADLLIGDGKTPVWLPGEQRLGVEGV